MSAKTTAANEHLATTQTEMRLYGEDGNTRDESAPQQHYTAALRRRGGEHELRTPLMEALVAITKVDLTEALIPWALRFNKACGTLCDSSYVPLGPH